MNKDILNTVNQIFIEKNLEADIPSLLFQKNNDLTIDVKTLVEQIESKRRCEKKLPTWFKTKNIYYPNKLNIEQTSSEITAAYKSHLVHGNLLIDLTGGFGVDSFYFSKQFERIIHCEIDPNLSEIAHHNFKQLKADNIETIPTDGLDYLHNSDHIADCIYLDPSRRHDLKGKVFLLRDCDPNVPKNLRNLFRHASTILIKTSPLLDISAGLKDLDFVRELHIVAIQNEVKELLWVLEKDFTGTPLTVAVNIKKDGDEVFKFDTNAMSKAKANYSNPLKYLYEPNAALMKSGCFNLISETFAVFKLHANTHLYTSNTLVDFPGRRFYINQVIDYNKKLLKKQSLTRANISVRNFSERVDQIRKTFKIKEGGKDYVFFTTGLDNSKIVLFCSKLN